MYLRDDGDGKPLKPKWFHLEWDDYLMAMLRGEFRFMCIEAPKGHAKSTVIVKGMELWLQAIDHNFRGITGSTNTKLAERFNRANRRELERNQLLMEDWGPFKPANAKDGDEVWRQDEYTIIRTSSSPSPTWRAVGAEMAVRGGRSAGVFGDDLVDLENSRTLAGRDKLQEWIDGDLLGTLEPDGFGFFIGTPVNMDDFYARAEKRAADPSTGWRFKRYDSMVEEESRTALWPERWSFDALEAKRKSVGTLTFNRDYRCQPVSDETSLFPLALLKRALRPQLSFEEHSNAPAVGGLDLAIVEDARQAQASDSDYTVPTVWRAIRRDDGATVRRLIWGERWRGVGFTESTKRATEIFLRHEGLREVVVESNQAQTWFASTLLKSARGELAIHKHSTSRLKADIYEGIPSLAALFENELIELPYGDERSRAFVDIFIAELFGLSAETHDDTVYSFYMSDIGFRRMSSRLELMVVKT